MSQVNLPISLSNEKQVEAVSFASLNHALKALSNGKEHKIVNSLIWLRSSYLKSREHIRSFLLVCLLDNIYLHDLVININVLFIYAIFCRLRATI